MGAVQQVLMSLKASTSTGPPYHRSITIPFGNCGSADSTNFTVLISGTYTFLKSYPTGEVENASGYDVWFTSDAAGSTFLSWETVSWNGTTGAVEYWVKVPTLYSSASGVDTVIYIWTGDASKTTFQGGSTGAAYDADTMGVWHYPDGTTLSVASSTGLHNGTTVGTPVAVAGKVGGGVSSNYSTAGWQNNGISYTLFSSNTPTLSCWVKLSDTTGYQTVAAVGSSSGVWMLNGKMDYYTTVDRVANTSVGTGSWVHIAMTHDGTNIRFYYNGAADGVIANGSRSYQVDRTIKDTGAANTLRGSLDELRYSDVVRSASWILAEYNNQNSPSTFYTISSPL